MTEIALKVKDLSKHFIIRNNVFSKKKTIEAVKNVNFEVKSGESLGLIGESGSGKTTIAIAHRLSTVLKSDQIVVMDAGRVVQVGKHSELLEQSPVYRRLYELQFHHAEDGHASTDTSV